MLILVDSGSEEGRKEGRNFKEEYKVVRSEAVVKRCTLVVPSLAGGKRERRDFFFVSKL